ncbi:uncharacterized protein LOC124833099 isoform X2 [Vigna umbellata]|uniref:uncharacterized protein LOC124833099 isoform X2 n=1 Tax=Vigna umbellata TaxID=87088 RepID=UPI001F5EF9FB|nr:uncharacterized protein LOC124833099 isoform X2 [Vigna umbellata]
MPDLPFQVGDLAESKSFQSGFRGAWFRCKIRDIRTKKAVISHLLEYFDYTDQKPSWIKLYQKPLTNIGKSKGLNKELMLRPSFPTFSRESEKLDVNAISEMTVIVNNTWKVGDLVDWYTDGCYWSGTVTKLLGNDKVQGDECRQPCARIIIPANSDVTDEVGRHTVRMHSSSSLNLKDYPDRSIARRKQSNSARNGMEINESDNVSSLHMDSSVEIMEIASISRIYNEDPAKKSSDRSLYLNSMSSNTIEAAIMDLEELVNRIKWLRDVLNLRVSPLSDTKQSWEFSKHHPSCK